MVSPLIALRHWLLFDLIQISLMLPAATISNSPPSSVTLGTYLPPAVDSNHVVLSSPDGMFNLNVETWRDSPGSYCMAGVRNVKINPRSMLWAAYNSQPLAATTCQLYLSEDGDLLFQYDGNQTVWQTHTAGMGVHNLSLQDSGNLVLQSKQGATLWQSFDQSPVLGFYSGMNFTANTTLYSASAVPGSNTYFSVPGSYGLELNNHSNLILFTSSDDSMSRFVYWSYSVGANTDQAVAYVTVENGLTFYDKHSTVLGSIAPTLVPSSNSTLRIALIDPPSGNLLAFYRIEHAWVQFYNSSLSACENPKYCSGNFYVCDMGTGACRCPPGFKQSGPDCEPPKPLPTYASNCSTVVDSSLYSIVSVNVSFQLPQLSALAAQYTAEVCGSLCVKNCSCKAALYDPASSSCSLFSVLQTVPTRGSNSSQVMLLKVLSERSSPGWKKVVIGVVCATIGALCLICLIVILWCKRGRRREGRESPNEEIFLQALPKLPPRFTYRELQMATKEFSTKLGSGGFGGVYEGVLPCGEKLAVKKLEEGHGQSSAQFRAEVATIGSVSHMNLVTLKGFCMEGESRLLVYEHMANGSLDRWLFGVNSGRDVEAAARLDWEKRCRIALNTAKGLAYLHHESAERIVHCDVKPENILLDAEFNAKVADFGLAKLVGRDQQSFAMTTLKGTRGYLAPEWLQDATITAKSDVYSYGVVLLELISGKRCLDADYGYLPTLAFRIATSSSIAGNPSCSSTSLNVEASPAASASIQGRGSSTTGQQLQYDPSSSMAALLDDRVREAVPRGSLERMVLIALWCVQPHPTSRPPMSFVVQMLEGVVPIPPPPLQSPSSNDHSSFLEAYEQLKSTSTTFPTFHHLEVPSQTATVDSVPTTPSSWLLAPSAR